MAYANTEELRQAVAPELLVMLADDDADGAPDTDVVERALIDASAEIDQALGRRYVTPVDPAPPLLARWCIDLAVARLFLRRREALPEAQARTAELTRRALAAIADGLAGLAAAQPLPESLLAENLTRGTDPIFAGGALDEY